MVNCCFVLGSPTEKDYNYLGGTMIKSQTKNITISWDLESEKKHQHFFSNGNLSQWLRIKAVWMGGRFSGRGQSLKGTHEFRLLKIGLTMSSNHPISLREGKVSWHFRSKVCELNLFEELFATRGSSLILRVFVDEVFLKENTLSRLDFSRFVGLFKVCCW